MKKTSFVSVRCQHYKIDAALPILDHAHHKRDGFTKSANIFPRYTKNNGGYYFQNANSCKEAFDKVFERYKRETGRKVRVDHNVLFEHVVSLSEAQYSRLENKYSMEDVRNATLKHLIDYAKIIRSEFGFEPLGIDWHLDEGREERNLNGEKIIVRNPHGHIMFFNHDFSLGRAPLRHLFKKGKAKNGRTHSLNPNFVRIQDIAYNKFKGWGFQRGTSKSITNKQHLEKEDFVKNKIRELEKHAALMEQKNRTLEEMNKVMKESLAVEQNVFEKIKPEIEQLLKKRLELKKEIEYIEELEKDTLAAIREGCELALREIVAKTYAKDRSLGMR